MKCPYCLKSCKNYHGVHIHFHYCWVKKFFEYEVVFGKKTREAMTHTRFIPTYSLPAVFSPFFLKGERGLLDNTRYCL